MKPIFKNQEHQQFFEREGYLILPLLSKEEVAELAAYYESLNLKDEKGFGFHVSMDQLNEAMRLEVRSKIWETMLPKMDEFVENYKAFVATYIVKESNPKGVVPAHQDWSFVDNEKDGYCSITCWTTLVDTNIDNGCMGVIKGSNRFMRNLRPSPSPHVVVPLGEHMFTVFPYLNTLEMKAGETLFFDQRTIHASPPNTTADIRLAVGFGITQKEAQFVHYYLKPDGEKNKVLKYKVDEQFFLKYDNALLSKMYEKGELIADYEVLEELPYTFDTYSSEELIDLIKDSGNSYNVPLSEKLAVLFDNDKPSTQNETISQEEVLDVNEAQITSNVDERTFFEMYTPANILREIKFKLTGK